MSSPSDLFEFAAPAHAADALLCDPASVAHAPHGGLLLPQYHVDEHCCMGGVYDDPFAHRAHDLVVDPMFGGLCATDAAAAAAAAADATMAHGGQALPTISVLSSTSWLSSAMDMSAFVDQLRTAQVQPHVASAAAAAVPESVSVPVAAASPSTPVSCAATAAAASAGSPHAPAAAAAAAAGPCTTSPAAIVYTPIKSEHMCLDDGACAQSLSADPSKPRKPRSIKRRYDEIELDPDLIRSVKESAWSDLQALEDKARLGTLLPEEEAEYKRQKRLVKNREAAAISRLRKKCFVDELERKIQDLTSDNARLSAEASSLRMQNAALAAEVSALRSALAATAAVVAPAASASCVPGAVAAAPVYTASTAASALM